MVQAEGPEMITEYGIGRQATDGNIIWYRQRGQR